MARNDQSTRTARGLDTSTADGYHAWQQQGYRYDPLAPAIVIVTDPDTGRYSVDVLNYDALGLYDTHAVPFSTAIRAEMFASNLAHLLALPIVRTSDDFATFIPVSR